MADKSKADVSSSSSSSPSETPVLTKFMRRKKNGPSKSKSTNVRSSRSSSSLDKHHGDVNKHQNPSGSSVRSIEWLNRPKEPIPEEKWPKLSKSSIGNSSTRLDKYGETLKPVLSVERLNRPKEPLPEEKWPQPKKQGKQSLLLTDEQVEKLRGDVMGGILYSGQFLGISRAVSEPPLPREVSLVQEKMMKKYFSIVYSISSVLYGITALIILFCIFMESIREFFADYSWIKYVFLTIYIVLSFVLSFCGTMRKTLPFNYIILFPLAGSAGLFAGAVAAQYELYSVLIGMISATLLTLGLTAISWIVPFHLMQKRILITAPLIAIIALSSCAWLGSYFYSFPIGQILCSGVLIVAYSIYLALTVRVIMSPGSSVLDTWDIVFGVTLIFAAKAALIFHFLDFCGMINKT